MQAKPITHPPLAVTILSRDAGLYAERLADNKLVDIIQYSTRAEEIDCHRVVYLLADPNLAAEVIEQCVNVKWIQSTWAGNTPLLQAQKTNYVLTGVKSVFGQQMSEFVFAHILYFSRNIAGFIKQQAEPTQRWRPQPYTSLKGKTLGILGAGSIASALLPVAEQFGMQVIGLNRSGESEPGYRKMFAMHQGNEFAKQVDYLVSLLPDTAQTENFIDKSFLTGLSPDAVLINAGRGSAIRDDDLIEAIKNGRLRAAVLDVFRHEPLPDDHAFWTTPGILVTQHTAAESFPDDIADIFERNINKYVSGEALDYQFDFDKGY